MQRLQTRRESCIISLIRTNNKGIENQSSGIQNAKEQTFSDLLSFLDFFHLKVHEFRRNINVLKKNKKTPVVFKLKVTF